MKVVFITNFYNHHQKPLADALYSMLGEDYRFIETAPISQERLDMGWGGEEKPSYVMQNYTEESQRIECQKIINGADVVICGSAPYYLIEPRLKAKKLTFLYTERLYKSGLPVLKWPVHLLRAIKKYARYKNFYVLCASAYAPYDFARIGSFIGKTYKWGYFTELKKYDSVDALIDQKEHGLISWVSRFIALKHPELPLEVAKRLKKEGYEFKIEMIGTGPLEDETKRRIESEGLEEYIELLGTMTPERVREHMDASEIFLFTSDRNEGWGAVLNESMNSACAVVASGAIGSVPFLLNDGENGFVYKDGDVDDLYKKVKRLLDNADERRRIAMAAYNTMADEWNAENAAKKFVILCEKALSGEYKPFPFECGVCSKSEIVKG